VDLEADDLKIRLFLNLLPCCQGLNFLENLAMWLVPLAAKGGYFMRMRGGIMETYWKVSEVAATIQVSLQTVYRYVANGEIPFHKLNKAVRFKPSEIESWMESRKAGVTMNQNGNIGGEVE
jgi:excisionase family DNA binding protein